MYILAGSHNFLLIQSISQSLAGRTAVLKLMPFSLSEQKVSEFIPGDINKQIFTGCYPRIFDKAIDPTDFYPYYIQNYVERDVRMIKNIGDLSKFIRFVKLCAGRIGQMMNLSSLANDCSIAVSTASEWIALLEASYIIYLLKPDHRNFSKRLVKTPKLYFVDTGLACSLLEIKSDKELSTHYLRGSMFENLAINEFLKEAYHNGREPSLTFWRDKTGNEVDLLVTEGNIQKAYEIKSGETYNTDYFKGIDYWARLSGAKPENCFVIYAGNRTLKTQKGDVVSWFEW